MDLLFSTNYYTQTCFFLFIKKENEVFTDKYLLEILNIENAELVNEDTDVEIDASKIIIGEDLEWIHILDDTFPSHLDKYISEFELTLKDKHDFIYCCIDDIGSFAFELILFEGGVLKRKYEVDYSGKTISNIGKPIKNEEYALSAKDNYEKAFSMLKQLGVNFEKGENSLRDYVFDDLDKFIFNEDEY